MIHSDAILTELSWQGLFEGYLTLLLLVHQLNFGPWWFRELLYTDPKSLSLTSNVKSVQSRRHKSTIQEITSSTVSGSTRSGGKFFLLKYFYHPLRKSFLPILPTWCNYRKTWMDTETVWHFEKWFLCLSNSRKFPSNRGSLHVLTWIQLSFSALNMSVTSVNSVNYFWTPVRQLLHVYRCNGPSIWTQYLW